MRGSKSARPSNGTILVLMLLAMGAVFHHATTVSIERIAAEAAVLTAVVAIVVLALRYFASERVTA